MPEHSEQDRFIAMLRDSIVMLCKSGFSGSSCVASVEGLLGITLNDRHVFLVSINEILQHHAASETNDSMRSSPLLKTEKQNNVGIIHNVSIEADSIEDESFKAPTGGSDQVVNLDNAMVVKYVSSSECQSPKVTHETFSSEQVFPSCSTGSEAVSCFVKAEKELILHSGKDCEKDNCHVTNSEIFPAVRQDDLVNVDEDSEMLQMKEEPCDKISVSSTDSDNLMSDEMFDPNAPPPESFWASRSRGPSGHSGGEHARLPLCSHDLHPSFNSTSNYANLTSLQYDDITYNASSSFLSTPTDNFDLMQNAQQRYGSRNVNFKKKHYLCHMCSYTSNRLYNLVRHIVQRHTSSDMRCPECSFVGVDREQLRCHWLDVHAQDHGLTGSRLLRNQIQRPQIP